MKSGDKPNSLSAGSRVGPYEVLGALGTGGMGEVYRARDPRLGREVAIKVLPVAFAADPDALQRFEREARAAGSLNHPGLLTIFDFGTSGGAPYLVSELLAGETLRQILNRGPIAQHRALDYGLQIAQALAVAHDKGIIHRDLKPDNLFATREGRVKILDFGLAKLLRPQDRSGSADEPTMTATLTEAGALLGTVGYMSPEQARGEPADQRADLFAFGAVLYEMFAGERAFAGNSAVDRLTAVLNAEPPALSGPGKVVPPAVDRIIRHCIAKNPADRFHSAHDVAIALQDAAEAESAAAPVVRRLRRWRWLAPILGCVALTAIIASVGVGRRLAATPQPAFRRLTYQRGVIPAARFTPDGNTIIYSAGWDGLPLRLFSTRSESPESSPIELPSANLLAISSHGMMAVCLRPEAEPPMIAHSGTLAQSPVVGGTPREMLEGVTYADWAPDGAQIAVVRFDAGPGKSQQLEYPPGTVLYGSGGWLSHVRISPNGDCVAFIEHPRDDRGYVMAVIGGHVEKLTDEWSSVEGLAWTRDGGEIWFSAAREGNARDLWAVSRAGKLRLVMRMAGGMTLHDISRDSRVLLTRDYHRDGILGVMPGETQERDLSWLDWSMSSDLSQDGHTLLLTEYGEGVGAGPAAGLRKMDGSPVVRLGDGIAMGLSPDGLWAVCAVEHPRRQLVLLPTGAGAPRALEPGPVTGFGWASWFRDGRRILFSGDEGAGHGVRTYVQEIAGGGPRPLTPEGIASNWMTADGTSVIAGDSLYPLDGSAPRRIDGMEPGDLPARISDDDGVLVVYRFKVLPAPLYEVDLHTGRRRLLRQLMPADPAGIIGIGPVQCTAGAHAYVYTYTRYLSDLYLTSGLR